MANQNAIAVVGEAIVALLRASLDAADLSGVPVQQASAADLTRGFSSRTITVHLYRVGIHSVTRNRAPRTEASGRTFRPSMPLELSFLITAWGADVPEQQRLLGLALRSLHDQARIPAAALNAATGDHDVFGTNEEVELIPSPVSQTEMVAIWEAAKANMQPSMPYVVRVIYLDSLVVQEQAPPVVTRGVDVVQR